MGHFDFSAIDREFVQLFWPKSEIVRPRVFDAGFQPNVAGLAAVDHGRFKVVAFGVGVVL